MQLSYEITEDFQEKITIEITINIPVPAVESILGDSKSCLLWQQQVTTAEKKPNKIIMSRNHDPEELNSFQQTVQYFYL